MAATPSVAKNTTRMPPGSKTSGRTAGTNPMVARTHPAARDAPALRERVDVERHAGDSIGRELELELAAAGSTESVPQALGRSPPARHSALGKSSTLAYLSAL